MCYNYENLIVRGNKRASREESFSNVSEADKQRFDAAADALSDFNSGEKNSIDSGDETESETVSLFPGQPSLIIPITTKLEEKYIFGFLPDWAKSPTDNRMSFNCRSETILEKPTWKKPFLRNQRCLVMASAFFEIDRIAKKRYRFSVIGQPQIFYAGIYNHWTDKSTGIEYKTFAIITTNPNSLVGEIHDRMPVILDEAAQDIWMNLETPIDDCMQLLKPYPSELMEKIEAPPPPRKKKNDNNLSLDF